MEILGSVPKTGRYFQRDVLDNGSKMAQREGSRLHSLVSADCQRADWGRQGLGGSELREAEALRPLPPIRLRAVQRDALRQLWQGLLTGHICL